MKCLITQLGEEVIANDLPKFIDLALYINAIGDDTYKSDLQALISTLSTLGVLSDFVAIYPMLGDSVSKAALNMLDINKYGTVMGSSVYNTSTKSIDVTEGGALVSGNVQQLISHVNFNYTIFSAFSDDTTNQNSFVSGIYKDSQNRILIGSDNLWTFREAQILDYVNDNLAQVAANNNTYVANKKHLICNYSSPHYLDETQIVVNAYIDSLNTYKYAQKSKSDFPDYTGEHVIASTSTGTSKCFFFAAMKRSFGSYSSEVREGIFNAISTFLLNVKGFSSIIS